jgi:hypothetical protein
LVDFSVNVLCCTTPTLGHIIAGVEEKQNIDKATTTLNDSKRTDLIEASAKASGN